MNRYTIFGNPVSHSRSPAMQTAGFKYLRLNYTYDKTVLIDENIKDIFFKLGLSGANITVPHKEYAYNSADIVVGDAKTIKAVNTYIKDEDKIVAYNTDSYGFMMAIDEFRPLSSVLIIGAGGTARAIAVALKSANIATTVANRTAKKLKFFDLLGVDTVITDNINTNHKYDLVVNATSAGLCDSDYPMSKDKLRLVLTDSQSVFDCIYGTMTPFLNMAKQLNIRYKDGEDMLLYQGVKAMELWTNTKATKGLIDCMRSALRDKNDKQGEL